MRPRSVVVDICKGTIENVFYSGKTIMLFGWVMFIGTIIIFFGSLPNLLEENSKTSATCAIIFLMLFQICLSISTMFFLSDTYTRFDRRVDSSNRLSAVNGCGDEYTTVPFIDLQADFETTEDNLNQLINFTVLMVVASLFVGVLTIPAYHCIHYVADLGDGRGLYDAADDIEAE